jgi:dimethylhistidine N-methyltransferase
VKSTSPGVAAQAARSQFASDVAYYLSLAPRQLPSQYLYDELGSALFEAICRLPWYGLTRAEGRLLSAHAAEIWQRVPGTDAVMELGPGSGEKLAMLLKAAPPLRLTAHLVDVSASALVQARTTLEATHASIVSHHSDYETGLARFAATRSGSGRALIVFLGSNIGNFDEPGREAFLRNVRAALRPRDALLIGVDLVRPAADLRLAYDDPLGVTAAFNRNLLVRINRELHGNFVLDHFAHRALWNQEASRVEMHLECRSAQQVEIPDAGLEFRMDAGESIWTESSYKFTPGQLRSLLLRTGFAVDAQWTDVDRFALTLAISESS